MMYTPPDARLDATMVRQNSANLAGKIKELVYEGLEGRTLAETSSIRALTAFPSARFYHDVTLVDARWSKEKKPVINAQFFVANQPRTLGILAIAIPHKRHAARLGTDVVTYFETLAQKLDITTIEVHGKQTEVKQQEFWRDVGYRDHEELIRGTVWVMEKELGPPRRTVPRVYGNPRVVQG